MGRAEEVEALANECAAVWTYIGGHLIEVGERRGGLASLDLERTEQALREYAALLRDTRPRFSGGARSQEDEDRCAPLVECLADLARNGPHFEMAAKARAALRAHRARSGDE